MAKGLNDESGRMENLRVVAKRLNFDDNNVEDVDGQRPGDPPTWL